MVITIPIANFLNRKNEKDGKQLQLNPEKQQISLQYI